MFRSLILVLMSLCAGNLLADDTVVRLKSPYSVAQTLDRFEAAVRAKGMTVFARIDHRAGAEGVGLTLDDNQVLIFGNPKVGTLLMQSAPGAGIDLPLKAQAWRDADAQVWLAYNEPGFLTARHAIDDRDAVVAKMRKALAAFAAKATAAQ